MQKGMQEHRDHMCTDVRMETNRQERGGESLESVRLAQRLEHGN